VTLVESVHQALTFQPRDPARLAYVTQTTLSVNDTRDIVQALKARFPEMAAPHKQDICYATTNRQEAIRRIAEACDLVLVVGSSNSSNSVRLVEVALKAGAKEARLIDDAAGVDWGWFEDRKVVGLTAGASAPESLFAGLVREIEARFEVEIEEDEAARETVTFKLPRVLCE